MDCVRAEDAYTSRLGYEEHIPGQVALLLWGGTLAVGCHLLRWEPAGFTDKQTFGICGGVLLSEERLR